MTATAGDTRKVQTAVVGTARSRDPVQMPESRFEADRFRSEYAHRSFWCGVWLGGCGRRLSTRVGRVRIPHFAHYPEFPERHVCRRRYTDSRSADHLYLSRDLERWLVAQGQAVPTVEMHGDFAEGGTCREAVLTLGDGQGGVSIEFMPGASGHEGGNAWWSRLFALSMSPPRGVPERQGFVLRARLGTGAGRYRTEIGTMTSEGAVHWSGLEECVLTERGLTTPHMSRPTRSEGNGGETAEVLGLPLATDALVAYPRGPQSSARHGKRSPGHPHRLAVHFQGQEEQRRPGHLWLPEPVRGLYTDEAHRIEGPAWADLDRSTPEQWSVRAQGLTLIGSVVEKPVDEVAKEEMNELSERVEEEAEENFVGMADPGPALDTPPLPETLLDWLDEAGWEVRGSRSARRWLTLALMHRSYVYETPWLPKERSVSLGVLDTLGSRWFTVCLMDLFVRELVPSGVGDQSAWLSAVQGSVLQQMRQWSQIGDHLLLGRGEEESGGRAKQTVRSQVVFQLLGVMALHGRYEVLATLVERAYRQSEPQNGVLRRSQWLTLLDRELGTGTYSVHYDRRGPDHSMTFHATLDDGKGRSVTGVGRSKAEARADAAQVYLERHRPVVGRDGARQGVERRAPDTEPLLPRVYRDLPEGARRVTEKLQATFSLPPSARGWIVQALTHASWAHENRPKVLSSAQKDNTLLAHHGSFVGQLLHAHLHAAELFGKTLDVTPEEARINTPEAGMWQELSHRIGASEGLLSGKGTKTQSKAAHADVIQALLAVFWREHGAASLDLLPEQLTRVLREQRMSLDPFTLLQRHFVWFQIDHEVLYRQSGPDHLRAYQAELSFGIDGEKVTVSGPMIPGAKKNATKVASRIVLDVVDRVGSAGEWDLGEEHLPVARVLLAAQIAGASGIQGKRLQTCVSGGQLGLVHLKNRDLAAFVAWAEQAEAVHGEVTPERLGGMMDLYERTVRTGTTGGSPRVRDVLRGLAGRVTDVMAGGGSRGKTGNWSTP